MSRLFISGDQSIGASASASVLPMIIQGWSPLGLTDLLTVQGTLKSLLQHHSSKASILQHSAFIMVPLSHPHSTTGKTIALTRQTFVGKVMSLLFNMLSSLVIAFLWRSKRLLISWLQSPFAVILEPRKIKSVTGSISSPSICHEVSGNWNKIKFNTHFFLSFSSHISSFQYQCMTNVDQIGQHRFKGVTLEKLVIILKVRFTSDFLTVRYWSWTDWTSLFHMSLGVGSIA